MNFIVVQSPPFSLSFFLKLRFHKTPLLFPILFVFCFLLFFFFFRVSIASTVTSSTPSFESSWSALQQSHWRVNGGALLRFNYRKKRRHTPKERERKKKKKGQ